MKHAALRLLALCLLLAAGLPARGQDDAIQGIPREVYYLMPSFSDGMIIFEGQAPAQGKLNICALDNTLRFLDKDGKELSAADESHILKVRIDTVSFLRIQGVYFRQYPVTANMGIALRREIKIRQNVKEGAYGGSAETSSISKYKNVYVDGVTYSLENNKNYPYEVEETLCLYQDGRLLTLSRKQLRKIFPDKKAEIDAWFSEGNRLPETVEEAKAMLRQWTE